MEKHSESRLSYLFAHLYLLSSDSFSSTLLSSNLSLLSASSLLCFSSVHIVGSLTSKLPSIIIEGSLEVKLPTIWRDEKAVSREKSQKRKDQKKEDAGARKGRKVAKHCVFSWFCGSGGMKSRLAKAAGAETSGEMRDEKLHAVVARSRFRSEKVQNTSGSDHFWKLRC